MTEKNIQMKHSNNGLWDNLYPITYDTNVFDSEGRSVRQNLLDIENELDNKAYIEDLPYVRVEDFGAVGDFDPTTRTGTNDSKAVQDAIDHIASSGVKGVVLLDAKNYLISNIQLKPNVIIKGQGTAQTTVYGATTDQPVFHNEAFEILTHCAIEDLSINGNNRNASWGIKLSRFTNNSYINNVNIKDAQNGMAITRSYYCYFSNIQITYVTAFGIHLTDEHGPVNGVQFQNIYINYANMALRSDASTKAITWVGCTFEHSNWQGTYLTNYPSGWTFIGCYWEANGLNSSSPNHIFIEASYDGEGAVTFIGGLIALESNGSGINYPTGRSLMVSGLFFSWNGENEKPDVCIKSGASINNILDFGTNYYTSGPEEFRTLNSTAQYFIGRRGQYRSSYMQFEGVFRKSNKTVSSHYNFSTSEVVPILFVKPEEAYVNVSNKSPSQCKNEVYRVQHAGGSSYVAVKGGLAGRTNYYLRDEGDYVEYTSDGNEFIVLSSNVSGT